MLLGFRGLLGPSRFPTWGQDSRPSFNTRGLRGHVPGVTQAWPGHLLRLASGSALCSLPGASPPPYPQGSLSSAAMPAQQV